MQEIVDATVRALEQPDPWVAFTDHLTFLCRLQAADRALANLLTATVSGVPELERLRGRSLQGVTRLIDRARASGDLRDDFRHEDVVLILMANAGLIDRTAATAPTAWRRHLSYVLAGFTPPAARRRPHHPARTRSSPRCGHSPTATGARKRRGHRRGDVPVARINELPRSARHSLASPPALGPAHAQRCARGFAAHVRPLAAESCGQKLGPRLTQRTADAGPVGAAGHTAGVVDAVARGTCPHRSAGTWGSAGASGGHAGGRRMRIPGADRRGRQAGEIVFGDSVVLLPPRAAATLTTSRTTSPRPSASPDPAAAPSWRMRTVARPSRWWRRALARLQRRGSQGSHQAGQWPVHEYRNLRRRRGLGQQRGGLQPSPRGQHV